MRLCQKPDKFDSALAALSGPCPLTITIYRVARESNLYYVAVFVHRETMFISRARFQANRPTTDPAYADPVTVVQSRPRGFQSFHRLFKTAHAAS